MRNLRDGSPQRDPGEEPWWGLRRSKRHGNVVISTEFHHDMGHAPILPLAAPLVTTDSIDLFTSNVFPWKRIVMLVQTLQLAYTGGSIRKYQNK